MRFWKSTVARIGLGSLAGLLLASVADAHEPVFSVGPETIYQGGVGVEVGSNFETAGSKQEYGLDYELIYGVTSKIALTLEVPQVARQETDNGSESGVGDLVLRGKYRFWTRDRLNSSDKASLILGVKVPTGKHGGDAPLGSGSTDPLFGLSLGHESRTWYGFGTFRYLLRANHDGVDLGDRILYDLAVVCARGDEAISRRTSCSSLSTTASQRCATVPAARHSQPEETWVGLDRRLSSRIAI